MITPTKKWAGGGFEIASNDSFTAGGIFALTHQWISVNEALPKGGSSVLIDIKDSNILQPIQTYSIIVSQ